MTMTNRIHALARSIVLKFIKEDDAKFEEEFRVVVEQLTKFVVDTEVM